MSCKIYHFDVNSSPKAEDAWKESEVEDIATLNTFIETTKDARELKRALALKARIIGINNRNLDTMSVDINVTRKLRPLIPPGRIVVSESGIKEQGDIQRLKEWRVDAVLIGKALVTASDTAAKIKELF